MASHPNIHELNARCDSDPVRNELWVASEWPSWKYILRGIGKRKCVAAAVEAIGRLDGPCRYPNYTGTGNLPYEVHDRIKARLYASLIAWLSSESRENRVQIADTISELAEAVAQERAKGWYVVCSDVPPINVFASLAEAVVAKSSFEAPIRQALVQAASLVPASMQRFRQELMRSQNEPS